MLAATLAAGCGKPTQAPPADVSAAESVSAQENIPGERKTSGQESGEGSQVGAAGEPAAADSKPSSSRQSAAAAESRIPQPTPEQIERWTVPPFAPLELLAICEWEKTSFTAAIAPLSDGKQFLVAGSRVLLWSVPAEAPEHLFWESEGEDQTVKTLAVAPDGQWFAAGDSLGQLHLWRIADREKIASRKAAASGIQHLAISPDGQEIASISYDGQVSTWNAGDLSPRNRFPVDASGLKRIEYAAPGKLAAAGETISLWNTASGERIERLSSARYRVALARSPDGARMVFGGEDALQFWNVEQAKEEGKIAQGVFGNEELAFSPDGRYLAATGGRSVLVWRLEDQRLMQVIDSFGWPISGLCWLPQSNLLAIASDIGCTRIWGASEAAQAAGLKPLHAPLAASPADAAPSPATQSQLEQLTDLRILPRLPGAETTVVDRFDLSWSAPASVHESLVYCRWLLEQQGWTLGEASLTAASATAAFSKDGFLLTVQAYDLGDGKTSVSLHHQGNYDLRRAPRFDGAPTEPMYESAVAVSYRTEADLTTIETSLLRKLHQAGWTGYTRLNASSSEDPQRRDLDFLGGGMTLNVSIAELPNEPNRRAVQYSLSNNNSSLPVPPDCGYVEFDGSTAPSLIAVTKLSLEEARDFYDSQLAAEGWLVRTLGRSLKEDHAWLSYLRGQCDLTIGLSRTSDGRTLVQAGKASGSLWELSQQKPDPAAPAPAGLEAADFPLLDGAPATFDSVETSIEVKLASATLAEAAARYGEALLALGWTAEPGGIRDEEYTLLNFAREGKEITLRARKKDGLAVLNFQGDGLLWTKPPPGAEAVVSFERYLRLNKLPAGLESLDRFEAAMRAILKKQDPQQPVK